MTESFRRRAGFKKHQHVDWPERKVHGFVNMVAAPSPAVPQWISEASANIACWRDDIRDVYQRWAISINAMHVAADRYGSNPELGLEIKTLRVGAGGKAGLVVLDTWTAGDTARNYRLATPALSAYGFTDLYGLLEEIIFDLYLIFHNGNPTGLMHGIEYRSLKKLYKRRYDDDTSLEKFQTAWAIRLSAWRQKKAYQGLHKVFAGFMTEAGLKRPSHFTQTDIEDWATTIKAVGEVRNLIVHGEGEISEELGRLSGLVQSNVFEFRTGEALVIELEHLMFMECFSDQLMNALGISLIEKAYGPIAEMKPPAPIGAV